jgi:hypothetical protein
MEMNPEIGIAACRQSTRAKRRDVMRLCDCTGCSEGASVKAKAIKDQSHIVGASSSIVSLP